MASKSVNRRSPESSSKPAAPTYQDEADLPEDAMAYEPHEYADDEERGVSTVRGSLTPIAVIGMSCRLPGGIDSPQKLWDALLEGADMVTEIPRDRWDAEEFYDPEKGTPGRSVSKWGAFIDDVTGFDPEFFGINEREATAMDPQHRMLMETSWEAVEHAGLRPAAMSGTATGVFIGMSHDDYVMVTNDAGIRWLRQHFPTHRVHKVRYKELQPWHMDSTLVPIRPGLVICNPARPWDRFQ